MYGYDHDNRDDYCYNLKWIAIVFVEVIYENNQYYKLSIVVTATDEYTIYWTIQ